MKTEESPVLKTGLKAVNWKEDKDVPGADTEWVPLLQVFSKAKCYVC